jgi:hypothetical protein
MDKAYGRFLLPNTNTNTMTLFASESQSRYSLSDRASRSARLDASMLESTAYFTLPQIQTYPGMYVNRIDLRAQVNEKLLLKNAQTRAKMLQNNA